MRRLIPFVLLPLLAGPSFGSPASRTTVVVDGKTYPVYEMGSEAHPKSRVNPVYPMAARDAGDGGMVVVGAVVDVKGKVRKTFIKESEAGADIQAAVRAAVARWRFAVIKQDGLPIEFVVFVSVMMNPN